MSNQRRNQSKRWHKLLEFIRSKQWNLTGADLRGADLRRAILSGADLSGANLSGADLREAYLREANLREANLREANLIDADLRGANLIDADLRGANLTWTNLSAANLRGADLTRAGLTKADLTRANLTRADLTGAKLSSTNLSGVTGMLSGTDWLRENFKRDPETGCYIVFKAQNAEYKSPDDWKWEPGAVLREVCNPNRTDDCGCGVNFGTLEYVRETYPNSPIWACLLTGIPVVPFHTDGKARTDELTLIGEVEHEQP